MLGRRLLAPLVASVLVLAGCGGVYQASSGARLELDAAREVNDEDVRKAFEAAPQLADRSRVAYYTFDDAKAADVEQMLATLPHVASTYRIPSLLVTGKRRFERSSPWEQPKELSMKQLRLLAARAHADVLVVVDYGYRGGEPNALCALNALLLPALFVPFLSNETESYAQALVLDVRNGYLYADVSAEDASGEDFVTIYARSPGEIFEEVWPELLAKAGAAIDQTLTPRPRPDAATAPTPDAPADGPAPPPQAPVPTAPGA